MCRVSRRTHLVTTQSRDSALLEWECIGSIQGDYRRKVRHIPHDRALLRFLRVFSELALFCLVTSSHCVTSRSRTSPAALREGSAEVSEAQEGIDAGLRRCNWVCGDAEVRPNAPWPTPGAQWKEGDTGIRKPVKFRSLVPPGLLLRRCSSSYL